MAVPEVRSVLAEIGLVSLVPCSSPGYFISTDRFSKQAKQYSTEPEMFFFFTRWGWLWRTQPIIVLEQNTPSYTTASGSATLLVRVPVARGRGQVHLKAKRLHPLVFIIQVRKMCELYILVSFVRCVSLLLTWYLPCFSQNQRRQGLQILGMFFFFYQIARFKHFAEHLCQHFCPQLCFLPSGATTVIILITMILLCNNCFRGRAHCKLLRKYCIFRVPYAL